MKIPRFLSKATGDTIRYIVQKPIVTSIYKNTKLNRDAVVLDLGCGYGLYTSSLQKQSNLVIGFDADPCALEHNHKLNHDASFIGGTLMKLPIKDSTIDFILCMDVIEHIEDDTLALFELSRVLKTGGMCIIGTSLADMVDWHGDDSKYGHKRPGYDTIGLRKMIETNHMIVTHTDFDFYIVSRKLANLMQKNDLPNILIIILSIMDLFIKPISKPSEVMFVARKI